MPITLPGNGEIVATRANPSAQHVEDISLMRSDALGTPITADANGLKVQLNSNAVTVSGTPTVSAVLTAGTAGIGKLTANSGIDIGDVDVTSVVPGTGATALGKARASAMGATDTGVAGLFVRQDTAADLAGADGDYAPGQMDSSGRVRVSATIPDSAGNAVPFDPFEQFTASPTLGTGVCAQYDSLHTTIITLSSVVNANGGYGTILGGVLSSRHASFTGQIVAYLFDASVTGTTAQDALSISDADMEKSFGQLLFDFARSNGAVSRLGRVDRSDLPMPFKCDAAVDDIFIILQLWSADTPTFAASDLKLRLFIQPE